MLLALVAPCLATSVDTVLLEGSRARSRGALDEAAERFEAGLDDHSDARLWTELAVTRSWSGDLEGALEAYEAALELDPAALGARLGQARVLGWTGDVEQAERQLQALASEGDAAPIQVALGDLDAAELRRRQAAEHYEAALALSPNDAEASQAQARLERIERAHLRADVGVLAQGGGIAPVGAGLVDFAFTPRLSAYAGARRQGRSFDGSQDTLGWALEGGLVSRHLSPVVLTPSLHHRPASDWLGAGLGVDVVAGPTVLQSSARLGRTRDGPRDLLLMAGAELAANDTWHPAARVYHFRDQADAWAWTLLAGLRLTPGPELAAWAGPSLDPNGQALQLSGELELPVSEHHDLLALLGIRLGSAPLFSASVGWSVGL